MTRIAGWLLLMTALTLGAQEPNAPEEVRPREVKPQWQRWQTGEAFGQHLSSRDLLEKKASS